MGSFITTTLLQLHFFHYYNDLMKLLWSFLVILMCWYKRHSICLVSFFSLSEFFPPFICANNIGSLDNSFFEVKIFNPFHFLIFVHHHPTQQNCVLKTSPKDVLWTSPYGPLYNTRETDYTLQEKIFVIGNGNKTM